MNELKVSSKKLEQLKDKFIYFNHVQELKKDYEDINWDYVPQEYSYFVETNRPYDALAFYNWYYGYYIFSLQNKKIDAYILNTLCSLDDKAFDRFEMKVNEEIKTWEQLNLRSHAKYRIDLNRSKGDLVTHSLLHVFSSAYENTELLFFLYWFCQALVGIPLNKDFNRYKDRWGNIKKGTVINKILKMLSKEPHLNEFRSVIKTAYNKDLRNICFHNSAILDDESRLVTSIDFPSLEIPYADVFKSMYSLQQLENHLKMYIRVLLIDKNNIANEGIFSLATLGYEHLKDRLLLIQLAPFYSHDLKNDAKLDEVSIIKEGNHYIFYSDKELLRSKRDEVLDEWFDSPEEIELTIISVQPDVFDINEDDLFYIGRFGNFIVVDEYDIENVIVKNKN